MFISDEIINKIVNRYLEGKSCRALEQEFKINRKKISSILKEQGYEIQYKI